MVRLTISNGKATSAIFTVDSEAAELRGLGPREAYAPLDVNAAKVAVLEAHSSESKFARLHPALPEEPPSVLFLLGPVELPKDHLLSGWLVFEVPKGTQFTEIRWVAGDTVYLLFQAAWTFITPPDDDWWVGRYQVTLLINDGEVATLPFSVTPP